MRPRWKLSARVDRPPGMSYDLTVWEGEQPAADATAGRAHEQCYAAAYAEGEEQPPTPRIRASALALLERSVDLSDGEDGVPMACLWAVACRLCHTSESG